MSELAGRLNRAREDAGLTISEMWLRYFALGGMASPDELEAYLHGALDPTAQEHNLIVHTINERFMESGRDHPVPYADEAS